MRIPSNFRITEGDILDAELFNRSNTALASEYNGGLDANNIPLLSLTAANVAAPTYGETSAAIGEAEVEGAAFSIWTLNAGKSGNTVHLDLDPETGDWPAAGWNQLASLASVASGGRMVTRMRAGSIIGGLTITVGWRQPVLESSGGGSHNKYGVSDHYRIGVQADGVLIADSGYVPCGGRRTLSIPFGERVQAGKLVFDIAIQAHQKGRPAEGSGTYFPEQNPNLQIFNTHLWVMNRYR